MEGAASLTLTSAPSEDILHNEDNKPPSRALVQRVSQSYLRLGSIFSSSSSSPQLVCLQCNGYYGPCFNEPVCSTCHAFLYANDLDHEVQVQHMTQHNEEDDPSADGSESDRDSGNEEPTDQDQEQGVAGDEDEEEEEDDVLEEVDEDEDEGEGDELEGAVGGGGEAQVPENDFMAVMMDNLDVADEGGNGRDEEEAPPRGWPRIISQPPLTCSEHQHYNVHIDTLSERLTLLTEFSEDSVNNSGDGIDSKLPPEVLLLIFSHLDDVSLYAVGNVCKRWRNILKAKFSSDQWHVYIRRRWPLFTPIIPMGDGFSTYSALVESSYCLTCIYQMAEVITGQFESLALREKRLVHDLRILIEDPPPGIRAQPLDSCNYHWQASVTGPPGSPYEGGLFFLYMKVPFTFPFDPPEVRFLTRIFHPNISKHGDIGVDCIQHRNWVSGLTIPKVLISIQSLLTDPFTEVCMEPEIGLLYRENRKLFDAIARTWTWEFAMHDAMPPKPRI